MHISLVTVNLFNSVFMSGQYPMLWSGAKIFTIFKKGDRKDPDHYRGISVANSIVKLYDMVLCNRLSLRFQPSREQAGAQKTRGFLEHIVTLRLLTDSARRKSKKLFVTFIDFSKACDVMPRHKMFITLKRLGCGMVTLAELIAMYNLTESVYGCAIITSIVVVR